MGFLVFIAAIVLTWPGLGLLLRGVFGFRRTRDLCWRCDFDLAGLRGRTERCPECGAPIEDGIPLVYRHERAATLALGLVLLMPLGIGLGMIHRQMLESGTYAKLTFHGLAADVRSGTYTPWTFDRRADTLIDRFAKGEASEAQMRTAVRYLIGWPAKSRRSATEKKRSFVGVTRNSRALNHLADVLVRWGGDVRSFDATLDAILDALESQPGSVEPTLAGALGNLAATRPVGDDEARRPTDTPDPLWVVSLRDPDERKQAARERQDDWRRWSHRRGPALTRAQHDRLIELFLAKQGSDVDVWPAHWGEAIEQGYAAGIVSDDQLRRSFDGALSASLEFRYAPPVRAGDCVWVKVQPIWRGGTLPILMRVRGVGEGPRDRVHGRFVSRGWVIRLDQDRLFRDGVWLMVPDEPGHHVLSLEVESIFDQGVIDQYHWLYGVTGADLHESTWRKLPRLRAVRRVELAYDVVASDAPVVSEDAFGVNEHAMIWTIDRWSMHWGEDGQGHRRLDLSVGFGRAPAGLAFEATAVQGDARVPLGWDFSPRFGRLQLRFAGRFDAFDPEKKIEIELASNPGALDRPTEFHAIWRGSLHVRQKLGRPAPWCADYIMGWGDSAPEQAPEDTGAPGDADAPMR